MRIYMRILIILLLLTLPCYAGVVLYRYTDKASGEERGLCYGNEGAPPVENPEWDVEIINEEMEKFYIAKHKSERDKKEKKIKEDREKDKEKAKKELEDLGISDETIEAILNR